MSATLPETVDARFVAEYLGLHIDTVAAKLRSGEIPGVKVGRRWYIPLDALVERMRPTAPGAAS